MKRFRKWLIMLSLLALVFFCFPDIVNAQPDAPDTVEGDPDAPIDGGIGVLLAVGIVYGIKKVRDYKREKEIKL